MTPTALSSGEKTADGAIRDGKALLCGVLIITDGTNPSTVILYDNNSAASGTKLFEAVVSGANNTAYFEFPYPVRADNGIYLDIAGTGASAIIYTN